MSDQRIEDFYDFYFDERGYLLHVPHWGSVDGVDDLFDIFGDWTILYSLGGRQSVLDLYRKGIPEDVAALVTGMNKEKTHLTLVNLSQTEGHTVIIQTGSYGEHQCSRVEVNGASYPVDDRLFTVHIAPGAGAELVVYADRFVNQPTLALPWHGDSVPRP